jgi:hypothetical protein
MPDEFPRLKPEKFITAVMKRLFDGWIRPPKKILCWRAGGQFALQHYA